VEGAGALALVGPGRAGLTVTVALARRGWRVAGVAGRGVEAASTRAAADRLGAPARPVAEIGTDADIVIVATPDAAIPAAAETLAASVRPDALVLHLSGARGLDALDAVPARRAALHPLQSLPTVELGIERLAGSWAAVAGDPQVVALAESIELRPFPLADGDRAAYHAAAAIASNHLVALLGQVERTAPVPLEVFLPLVRATVDNVAALGPSAALTGPVARGDVDTVRAHLGALPAGEHEAYRALARAAHTLVDDRHPGVSAVLS
jgi:predicted short-subunit dehydrogenase-like oxidoreductase (DUF2520 family)